MAEIIDHDMGWDDIKKSLVEATKKGIKVGIQAGEKTEDGKSDLPYIAWLHEFGSPHGMIPKRTFLRTGLEEKQGQIESSFAKVAPYVFAAGADIEQILNIIGQESEGIIKAKIVAGPFLPDKPATIKAKKSSSPLIDSGHMKDSIRAVVCDMADIVDE